MDPRPAGAAPPALPRRIDRSPAAAIGLLLCLHVAVWTWAGSALVVGAGIYTIWREARIGRIR